MPWLPGFVDVFAAADVRPADLVAIDDPIVGLASGVDAVDRYLAVSAGWRVTDRFTSRAIGLVVGDGRAVGEFELSADVGTRVAVLPVAIVVDATGSAPVARVYESEWPLTGKRIARRPLLPAAPGLRLPHLIDEAHRALASADVEGCVAGYEPDGCLQGSGGPAHAVCGTEALRVAYAAHLANGGIVLDPWTVTAGPDHVAVEFTLRSWGGVPLDQAGLSVYALGPTRRFAWNRVYDDAANPALRV